MKFQQNCISNGWSSERSALSKNSKWLVEANQKNDNQAHKERSSTSINQHTEIEKKNKTLEFKFQQLKERFSFSSKKQIKEKPKIFHLSDTYHQFHQHYHHQRNKTISIYTKKQKTYTHLLLATDIKKRIQQPKFQNFFPTPWKH